MLPIINLQAVNRTAHTEYMGAPKKKKKSNNDYYLLESISKIVRRH